MNKIKLIFIILFLILVNSHSNSNELNNLFLKLKNAENFSKAINIEKKNTHYYNFIFNFGKFKFKF